MKMIKGSIPKFLEMTLIPVVMILAWKEWCEQAALVQSDLYGYGMLESLRDCVEPPEPWRIILLYLMSGDVSIVRWRILNTLCMYYVLAEYIYRDERELSPIYQSLYVNERSYNGLYPEPTLLDGSNCAQSGIHTIQWPKIHWQSLALPNL